jgi:hypothetical protein
MFGLGSGSRLVKRYEEFLAAVGTLCCRKEDHLPRPMMNSFLLAVRTRKFIAVEIQNDKIAVRHDLIPR